MAANTAAVLTTQFNTDNSDLTVRSLKALVGLPGQPVRRILIVHDEKEPNGAALATDAVQRMAEELSDAHVVCETLAVNTYSTARRWWPALCAAFTDRNVDKVLNFPGDLREDLSPEQLATLAAGITAMGPGDLTLFDYQSNDDFKQMFDQFFLLPLLRVGYPNCLKAIEELNHSKLRTEFFCVGRAPFGSLRGNFGVSWGTDPTIQLVINSLRNKFSIRSVHFGDCKDDASTRSDPAGKTLQIVRVGHQILNDRIISSGRGEPALTTEELIALNQGVHGEIERCLGRNAQLATKVAPLAPGIDRQIRIATHVVGGTTLSETGRPSTLQRIAEVLAHLLGEELRRKISLLVLVQPVSSALLNSQARQEDERCWGEEATRLNAVGAYPAIEVLYDREHTPYEPPTLAWRALHRHTFNGASTTDALLYFDVNLIHWSEAHRRLFKAPFLRLLNAALAGSDLVLGDYHPVAPLDNSGRQADAEVKQTIERVVKQMLREAYPDLFRGWPLFESLERPRTEFHAISRRLYQHLGKKPHGPFDFGLFTLVLARCFGLKIAAVNLGDVPEVTRNPPSKIVDQISRVSLQIEQMRNYHRMLNPVNPKLEVLGLEAKFAPFKGYSLLFDNPAEAYDDRDGVRYVACRGPGTEFYRALFDAFEALDIRQLRLGFSLCPLDPRSAHCTCLDGHNPVNLEQVHSDHRGRIAGFLDALPVSMTDAAAALPEFASAHLATKEWPIDFMFDELAIWGGIALVAKLKPADEPSRANLQKLEEARAEFVAGASHLGLQYNKLTPHISLAYFADPQFGERAEMQVPYWTGVFQPRLSGIRLRFRRVSLHGFTDMVTFFKLG
jgi:hypothetical protein